MRLITNTTPSIPAPTSSVEEAPIRRAPSLLSTPALDDASATASASLQQVASYVEMLHVALGENPTFYQRLIKRGFLDAAIDYARYATSILEYDKLLDNDGFQGMIEGAVLEGLLSARNMGTPAIAEPDLSDELAMARAAAMNAAKGLDSLVAGHRG